MKSCALSRLNPVRDHGRGRPSNCPYPHFGHDTKKVPRFDGGQFGRSANTRPARNLCRSNLWIRFSGDALPRIGMVKRRRTFQPIDFKRAVRAVARRDFSLGTKEWASTLASAAVKTSHSQWVRCFSGARFPSVPAGRETDSRFSLVHGQSIAFDVDSRERPPIDFALEEAAMGTDGLTKSQTPAGGFSRPACSWPCSFLARSRSLRRWQIHRRGMYRRRILSRRRVWRFRWLGAGWPTPATSGTLLSATSSLMSNPRVPEAYQASVPGLRLRDASSS